MKVYILQHGDSGEIAGVFKTEIAAWSYADELCGGDGETADYFYEVLEAEVHS